MTSDVLDGGEAADGDAQVPAAGGVEALEKELHLRTAARGQLPEAVLLDDRLPGTGEGVSAPGGRTAR